MFEIIVETISKNIAIAVYIFLVKCVPNDRIKCPSRSVVGRVTLHFFTLTISDSVQHQSSILEQVEDLKTQNLDLKSKLENLTKEKKPPKVPFKMSSRSSPSSDDLQEHLKELNETICKYLTSIKICAG